MNQLLVLYKGGHKRVVNLDKTFFENEPAFNKQWGKFKTQTIDSRAISLANYLDPDPYTIELVRNGETVIKHTYPTNKPEYGTYSRTS